MGTCPVRDEHQVVKVPHLPKDSYLHGAVLRAGKVTFLIWGHLVLALSHTMRLPHPSRSLSQAWPHLEPWPHLQQWAGPKRPQHCLCRCNHGTWETNCFTLQVMYIVVAPKPFSNSLISFQKHEDESEAWLHRQVTTIPRVISHTGGGGVHLTMTPGEPQADTRCSWPW